MRRPRVSQGVPILLGFSIGIVVVAWLPWQFAAIAVCILFVFALATHYGAKAKMPPERGAKVEVKKDDRAN
jgi:hypothetical protein